MLTKYCLNIDCARPNYYTLETPVVCGFCGCSLDNASVAASPPKNKPIVSSHKPSNVAKLKNKINRVVAEMVEDQDYIYEIPDIENLKAEIVGTGRQKLTLGQLGTQKKTGFGPRPVENISQKEAIQQFVEEAKAKTKVIEMGDDGGEE